MMNRRAFVQIVPFGALLGGRRGGRATRAQSPEGAARAAFDLMKRGDADALVRTIEPGSLARFRHAVLQLAATAVEANRAGGVRSFLGVDEAGDRDRLDDTEFFRAYWTALMRSVPGLREALDGAQIRTYGHVMEGRESAHVLYRLAYESGFALPILVPRVVTLHWLDDGWAVALRGEIECAAAFNKGGQAALPHITGSEVAILGVIEEKGIGYVVYRCNLLYEGGVFYSGMYVYGAQRSDDHEWDLVKGRDFGALVPIIAQRHGLASPVAAVKAI